MKLKGLKFGALAGAMLCAAATNLSAQGAGASVDWEATIGEQPTIFYDAPANFDKHYRICFQDFAATVQVTVALADRELNILRERCVDVVSHKISVKVAGTGAPVSGIFYLVE